MEMEIEDEDEGEGEVENIEQDEGDEDEEGDNVKNDKQMNVLPPPLLSPTFTLPFLPSTLASNNSNMEQQEQITHLQVQSPQPNPTSQVHQPQQTLTPQQQQFLHQQLLHQLYQHQLHQVQQQQQQSPQQPQTQVIAQQPPS